jgi:predicted nuclease with TOPRIM domain
MLDLQTRLDRCTEELQQTLREKSEFEILVQQTKTGLSHANDAIKIRVSRLMEERDESMDGVESRHAEMDQVQGRLRELEAEKDSLRAQLDKAVSDQMRVRASLEAELRKSTERFAASRVELDDLKAQLSALDS